MDGAGFSHGKNLDDALRRAKVAAKRAAREVEKAGKECQSAGDYLDSALHGARRVSDHARKAYDETFNAEPENSGWVERDPQTPQPFRSYAGWIHGAGALAWVATLLSAGITFFAPLLVVLVMWQSRKHDSPFLDDHGREAMNFQISLFPLAILSTVVSCGLGLLVLPIVLPVFAITFGFLGLRAAGRAEYYRYPMTFRFLKGPQAG